MLSGAQKVHEGPGLLLDLSCLLLLILIDMKDIDQQLFNSDDSDPSDNPTPDFEVPLLSSQKMKRIM